MAGIRPIVVLFSLQLAAILLASYLGYARTVVPAEGGRKRTSFSDIVQQWRNRLFSFWDSDNQQQPPQQNEPNIQQGMRDLQNSVVEENRLQVPCGYIIASDGPQVGVPPKSLDQADVFPLPTYLDPLHMQSTIALSVVVKDRVLKLLYDESGDAKVIPRGALFLRMGSLAATVPSPELLVVEDDDGGDTNERYSLRLGRDFLRATQARIDLDEMELYVTIGEKANVMIPFLQSRGHFSSGEGEL